MKKINVMKLTICFAAFAFLVNASFAEAGSVKVGEVYKYLYKNESIEVISSTEVELSDKNVILLGEYSFKNGKLRVVATAMGTKMVQYYQITGDGLVDKDGNILYSKKRFAKAAGKTLVDQTGEGNWSRVRSLLNNGADPNVKDKYGFTALIWAAINPTKGIEIVKLLIDHGADVNAKTKDGYTALSASASIMGNYEIAKLLIDHGADVNAKTKDGTTALMDVHNYEIARLLIDHGADVNAKTKDGKTALMQEVGNGTKGIEIVKLLIKNGADVNAKNADGKTTLMLAAKEGDFDLYNLLINAGANDFGIKYSRSDLLNNKNNKNCTAIKADLANLAISEEAYSVDNDFYQATVASVTGFVPSPGVIITIKKADKESWAATGTHPGCKDSYTWDSSRGGLQKPEGR